MARQSKKHLISATALELLLTHGIKAMSVDMVVKASGVSKPTVYNHFADKAQLVHDLMAQWLNDLPWPTLSGDRAEVHAQLCQHWQQQQVIRLYGIFFGEGDRCPEASALFFQQYHQPLLGLLQQSSLGEQAQTSLHDWLMQQLLAQRSE